MKKTIVEKLNIKQEIEHFETLFLDNVKNFEKDSFALVYGKDIDLDLESDGSIGTNSSGEEAFKIAMDKSIANYNNNSRCEKLSDITYIQISIFADFSTNLDKFISSIDTLLKSLGNNTEVQFVIGHTKNKKSVDINIIGLKNYCDCKYHYYWEHLFK